jgi:PAS domain S-box-containing protein
MMGSDANSGKNRAAAINTSRGGHSARTIPEAAAECRSEDALRRSEQLLSDFFENAAVGLHWVGADGRILRANRTELELLGYSKEEYIGRHIAEFHVDPAVIEDILRRLSAGETLDNYEARLRCKDGSIKHVLLSSNVLWENGKFVHTRCFTRDITRQKLAEQALRETEHRKSAILNAAMDAIITIDHHGAICDFNPAAEQTFGYRQEEAIGRPLAELIIPERLRLRHSEGLARFLVSEEDAVTGKRIEMPALHADGHEFPVEFSISRIASMEPPMFTATLRDITAWKRNEEQIARTLRELNDLKTALDEHAIVAVTDARGKITYVNDKFCAISKYSREELLGQDHRIINSGKHSKDFFRKLWETIGAGRVWKGEIKNRAKDGSYYWVDTTIVPYLGSDGKPVQYIAIRTDITERKQAEDALKAAQERLSRHAEELEHQVAERTAHLNESVQSLEGVCYTMAHDLRAPLRAVQGFAQILLDEHAPALDPDGQRYAQRILNRAMKMDALIHDLLNYARLSHAELPITTIDLTALVEKVVRAMSQEIETRNAQVTFPSLPAIQANERLVAQILTNLLANALKFVAPGVTPQIQIRSEVGPEFVRLSIHDNGIGIEPQFHERVFEVFQRLHADEQIYPGTGVGLAIVKKGMERMGGRVKIDPAVPSGTCFHLDFYHSPGEQ